MKKAVKVLSTAALAATLVAPVAVTPVSAASTYTVTAVQSVNTGWVGDGSQTFTRIAVKIPAGTIGNGQVAKMKLRLPADAYAQLRGVAGTTVLSQGASSTGVAEKSVVTFANNSGADVTATVTVTYGASSKAVTVSIANGETPTQIADKVANAIKADATLNSLFDVSAAAGVLTVAAKPVNGFHATNYEGADLGVVVTGLNTTTASEVKTDNTYGPVTASTQDNIAIPTTDANGNPNSVEYVAITPSGADATYTNAYKEFDIVVGGGTGTAEGLVYLDITRAYIPSGTTGAFNVTIESADNVLSSGNVAIANVGSGSVTTSVDDVRALQNKSDQPIDTIRIKEDRPGALKAGEYTLKLPTGFKWNDVPLTATKVWGDGASSLVITKVDERKIKLTIPSGGTSTSQAGYYTISGLSVDVDDSIAKTGEVNLTIDGDSSLTNSSLLIANYGDYGTSATASDAPTVLAGKDGQEIGKITITESTPGSLLNGRTIKLTLSGNAKWNPENLPRLNDSLSDKQGVTISPFRTTSDPAVIVADVTSTQNYKKAAKLVFEKGEIDTAANASEQDVKVTIGGTASATGEVVVAKMVPSVTVAAEGELPKAVIGAQEQAVADFTITEAQKGMFEDKGAKIELRFPEGVKPTLPSKVEVVDGDLTLDTSNISKDGRSIFIPVKYDSTKPSKIKVSGVKVVVDRTVPEGDMKVEVRGDAVVTTDKAIRDYDGDGTKDDAPFQNNSVAGSAVVAKVVTPAATDVTAQNIVFKLNSKTYTVDGKEVEMDTAPLVGWDRAYLPVRFAANALNVKDDNIIWDDKTSTFTIFKGDRVITGKVGDKFLTVNGVKVPMDVPVWRDKAKTNNRVMVPIRYLSNALGADIQWNKETSEITIGVK